ncbi:TIGR04372 family glycosyltransferase [Nisaea sediminum]|uniref:TIGR04372 family glycosyltransferase n=1 Tax=Nisaea sediminum TaxID=2775867 RepID=UPI001865CDD7|nr:TIGR04372 family glycosyltransferase [Nisaea sediminum]
MHRDRTELFRAELTEPDRLAHHLGRLLDLVRPHIRPGAKSLVYVNAQVARIGHLTHEAWCLAHMRVFGYDQIIMVTAPLADYANKAFREVMDLEFETVETDDLILTTLGFIDAGLVSVGGTDLLLLPTLKFSEYHTRLLAGGADHVFFTLPDSIRARTEGFLEARGLDPRAPFVVMHVRDAGFAPEMSYHSFRFSPIETYRPAVERLLESGLNVLRIGDVASPALEIGSPNYVEVMRDEAYEDYLDVGLCGLCRMGICTLSGPWSLMQGFGKPIFFTNAYPQTFWSFLPQEVTIYKHFFDSSGHELSYAEQWQQGVQHVLATEEFAEKGLTVESNSPEELLAGAEEMLKRLEDPQWEDVALQRRYTEVAGTYDPNIRPPAGKAVRWPRRLGVSYAKLNPNFLE